MSAYHLESPETVATELALLEKKEAETGALTGWDWFALAGFRAARDARALVAKAILEGKLLTFEPQDDYEAGAYMEALRAELVKCGQNRLNTVEGTLQETAAAPVAEGEPAYTLALVEDDWFKSARLRVNRAVDGSMLFYVARDSAWLSAEVPALVAPLVARALIDPDGAGEGDLGDLQVAVLKPGNTWTVSIGSATAGLNQQARDTLIAFLLGQDS